MKLPTNETPWIQLKESLQPDRFPCSLWGKECDLTRLWTVHLWAARGRVDVYWDNRLQKSKLKYKYLVNN